MHYVTYEESACGGTHEKSELPELSDTAGAAGKLVPGVDNTRGGLGRAGHRGVVGGDGAGCVDRVLGRGKAERPVMAAHVNGEWHHTGDWQCHHHSAEESAVR